MVGGRVQRGLEAGSPLDTVVVRGGTGAATRPVTGTVPVAGSTSNQLGPSIIASGGMRPSRTAFTISYALTRPYPKVASQPLVLG